MNCWTKSTRISPKRSPGQHLLATSLYFGLISFFLVSSGDHSQCIYEDLGAVANDPISRGLVTPESWSQSVGFHLENKARNDERSSDCDVFSREFSRPSASPFLLSVRLRESLIDR